MNKAQIQRMKERLKEARRLIRLAKESNDQDNLNEALRLVRLVKLQCETADFTQMDDSTFEKVQDLAVECTSILMRYGSNEGK